MAGTFGRAGGGTGLFLFFFFAAFWITKVFRDGAVEVMIDGGGGVGRSWSGGLGERKAGLGLGSC